MTEKIILMQMILAQTMENFFHDTMKAEEDIYINCEK